MLYCAVLSFEFKNKQVLYAIINLIYNKISIAELKVNFNHIANSLQDKMLNLTK